MPKANSPNVPAFMRKRSLSAKARKKTTTTRTTRATTTRTRRPARATRPRYSEPEEITLQPSLPSNNLFPDPLIDDEPETISTRSASDEIREMKECGYLEGYFDNIDVAVVQVTSPIRVGDRIIFETDDGLFEQTIDSMQINRKDVTLARPGSDIGMKVALKPEAGKTVSKIQ